MIIIREFYIYVFVHFFLVSSRPSQNNTISLHVVYGSFFLSFFLTWKKILCNKWMKWNEKKKFKVEVNWTNERSKKLQFFFTFIMKNQVTLNSLSSSSFWYIHCRFNFIFLFSLFQFSHLLLYIKCSSEIVFNNFFEIYFFSSSSS